MILLENNKYGEFKATLIKDIKDIDFDESQLDKGSYFYLYEDLDCEDYVVKGINSFRDEWEEIFDVLGIYRNEYFTIESVHRELNLPNKSYLQKTFKDRGIDFMYLIKYYLDNEKFLYNLGFDLPLANYEERDLKKIIAFYFKNPDLNYDEILK